MLELIPFCEDEALISIFLGKRGKWFILEQIARVVFGWSVDVIRRKLTYNSMTTQNKYNVEKCTDPYLLDQLKAIKILDYSAISTFLISLASLDLFIKSYSRRLSLFTRLYDTIHRLQWGTAPNGGPAAPGGGGLGVGGGGAGGASKKCGSIKGKRSLTSADKKYIASLQKWQCAWCGDMLPARFEVDHIVQFADGGTDDPENLQALCPNCHSDKTELDRQTAKSAEAAKETVRNNPYMNDLPENQALFAYKKRKGHSMPGMADGITHLSKKYKYGAGGVTTTDKDFVIDDPEHEANSHIEEEVAENYTGLIGAGNSHSDSWNPDSHSTLGGTPFAARWPEPSTGSDEEGESSRNAPNQDEHQPRPMSKLLSNHDLIYDGDDEDWLEYHENDKEQTEEKVDKEDESDEKQETREERDERDEVEEESKDDSIEPSPKNKLLAAILARFGKKSITTATNTTTTAKSNTNLPATTNTSETKTSLDSIKKHLWSPSRIRDAKEGEKEQEEEKEQKREKEEKRSSHTKHQLIDLQDNSESETDEQVQSDPSFFSPNTKSNTMTTIATTNMAPSTKSLLKKELSKSMSGIQPVSLRTSGSSSSWVVDDTSVGASWVQDEEAKGGKKKKEEDIEQVKEGEKEDKEEKGVFLEKYREKEPDKGEATEQHVINADLSETKAHSEESDEAILIERKGSTDANRGKVILGDQKGIKRSQDHFSKTPPKKFKSPLGVLVSKLSEPPPKIQNTSPKPKTDTTDPYEVSMTQPTNTKLLSPSKHSGDSSDSPRSLPYLSTTRPTYDVPMRPRCEVGDKESMMKILVQRTVFDPSPPLFFEDDEEEFESFEGLAVTEQHREEREKESKEIGVEAVDESDFDSAMDKIFKDESATSRTNMTRPSTTSPPIEIRSSSRLLSKSLTPLAKSTSTPTKALQKPLPNQFQQSQQPQPPQKPDGSLKFQQPPTSPGSPNIQSSQKPRKPNIQLELTLTGVSEGGRGVTTRSRYKNIYGTPMPQDDITIYASSVVSTKSRKSSQHRDSEGPKKPKKSKIPNVSHSQTGRSTNSRPRASASREVSPLIASEEYHATTNTITTNTNLNKINANPPSFDTKATDSNDSVVISKSPKKTTHKIKTANQPATKIQSQTPTDVTPTSISKSGKLQPQSKYFTPADSQKQSYLTHLKRRQEASRAGSLKDNATSFTVNNYNLFSPHKFQQMQSQQHTQTQIQINPNQQQPPQQSLQQSPRTQQNQQPRKITQTSSPKAKRRNSL